PSAAERGVGLRTCDPEPRPAGEARAIVASAETLACAVATGEIGDPRSFKRPVRVTVPRTLPTDDVLVARERRSSEPKTAAPVRPLAKTEAPAWRGALSLEMVEASAF